MGGKKFTDSWNFNKGDTVDLYTYTNADEVELILNGKSLGRRKNMVDDAKQRNRIIWEGIPYSPGKIEARAYDGEHSLPVAIHALPTRGKAKRLVAVGDKPEWNADGMDLMHVRVEAIDRRGLRDKSADSQLEFIVEGNADIVGVINGDMNSDELTVGNKRSLYNGTATLILRSRKEPGSVTLKIRSADFPEVKKIFNTK